MSRLKRYDSVAQDWVMASFNQLVDKPIPAEYQRLLFLQSASGGNCYIDTGIAPSRTQRIEVGCTWGNSNESLFGAGVTDNFVQLYFSSANKFSYRLYGSSAAVIDNSVLNNYYTIIFDIANTKVTINGTEYSLTAGAGASISQNMYLFTRNTNGSPAAYATNMRVFFYKVYDDDALVCNLIPCYRKSDGVAGFYDTVTDTFITNSGSGTFVKGDEI